MRFLLSTGFIKIMIGAALVIGAVALYFKPTTDIACPIISDYPGKSAVFSCPPGLSTVSLRNNLPYSVYTTLSTTEQASGWLTVPGDVETIKTLPIKLGPPVVLGPGAFMAIGSGRGLVYLDSKVKYLVSVVWDVPNN